MNAEDMTVHVEVLQETQGKKNGLLDLYVPPALLYVDSLVAMFCPTSEILWMLGFRLVATQLACKNAAPHSGLGDRIDRALSQRLYLQRPHLFLDSPGWG